MGQGLKGAGVVWWSGGLVDFEGTRLTRIGLGWAKPVSADTATLEPCNLPSPDGSGRILVGSQSR